MLLADTPTNREKFNARIEPPQINGCLLWKGAKIPDGYGQFPIGNHKKVSAHRVSWEGANQKTIPPGKVICHTCDTPSCVNPDHLFLGTHADNHRDSAQKGRRNTPRKVTTVQMGEIVTACQAGIKTAIVAAEYGITPEQVRNILKKAGLRRLRSGAMTERST